MNTTFSWAFWSSIFAGMSIMIIAQFTLSLLGMSVGLFAVNPEREHNQFPVKALTAGAVIWWFIISIVSVSLGSWVAARLTNTTSLELARMQGVLTWAATMLVSIYLFTKGAGLAAAGAMGMVSQALKALGAVGGAIGAAGAVGAGAVARDKSLLSEITVPQLGGQLQNFTNRIKKFENSQEARQQIAGVAVEVMSKGPDNINESDKEKLEHVITKYTDIPQREVRGKIDQLVSSAADLQERTQHGVETGRQAANVAAKGLAGAAFASFVMLVLTFIAAFIAGSYGVITT